MNRHWHSHPYQSKDKQLTKIYLQLILSVSQNSHSREQNLWGMEVIFELELVICESWLEIAVTKRVGYDKRTNNI